jgi:hypothetical protein
MELAFAILKPSAYAVHRLLVTDQYPVLTAQRSLLVAFCLLLTAYCLLLAACCLQITALAAHYSQCDGIPIYLVVT